MHLLELPNELLWHIIEEVDWTDATIESTEDIINFEKACPDISLWMTSRPGHHSIIDWSFRHVSLSTNTSSSNADDGTTHHPFDLLRDILPNRRLATYIRSLDLGKWDNPRRTVDEVLPGRQRSVQADRNFTNLIWEEVWICAYVPCSEKAALVEDIKYGDADAAAAMLLTLLPGIRKMTLLEGFVVGDWLQHMVCWMAEASERLDFDINSAPLRNLREVRTESRWDLNGDEHIAFLAQCAALPSARLLSCEQTWCVDNKWGRPWGWQHPFGLVNIREIDIMESEIRPDLLGCLLERTPFLKTFSYKLESKWNHEWFPFELCQILEDYVRHSLEELNLICSPQPSHWGSCIYLGSLHRLTKLRWLQVRSKMLAYPYEDGTEDLTPLVESLPASIEHIVLTPALNRVWGEEKKMSAECRQFMKLDVAGNLSLEDTARLFEGLTRMKDNRLPNLKSIGFTCPYQNAQKSSDAFNKKIRMACKAAGVSLLGCGRGRRNDKEDWVDHLPGFVEDEVLDASAACLEDGLPE